MEKHLSSRQQKNARPRDFLGIIHRRSDHFLVIAGFSYQQGPEASQKATPNFGSGVEPTNDFIHIFDVLIKWV
jgi:hypothetical protein